MIKIYFSLVKTNLALEITKPDLRLFTNNLDLVEKGFTIFLFLNLVKNDYIKLLNLAVLTLIFSFLTLLLIQTLLIVLFSVTSRKSFIEISIFMVFSIEVNGPAI